MEINRQKNEKESTTQNSTRMRSRAKITRKRESLCVNIGMYTYHCRESTLLTPHLDPQKWSLQIHPSNSI